MPTSYLELVNRVNRKVNEVELNSSNFVSSIGFYGTAKDAVNDAIWRINQYQFQWPFNNTSHDETLVPGQIRYSFQSNTKHVDFDGFRIQRSDILGNNTQYLSRIDYEEYLKYGIDAEYNTANETIRGVPMYVFQTQDQKFGVYPAPDKAYTLTYEYYSLPTALVVPTDTPTIPEAFDHIIQNGAMEYVYDFRGDIEMSMKYGKRFTDQIDEMRRIYINRQDHIKDTRIPEGRHSTSHIRTS